MRLLRYLVFAVTVTMMAAAATWAQEGKPTAPGPKAQEGKPTAPGPKAQDAKPAAPTPGPKAKQFEQAMGQWRDMLAELTQLQAKYRAAGDAERPEIRKQYAEVVHRGTTLEPQLIEAAQQAYAESPNADPRVSELLIAMLSEWVKKDDYEKAWTLGDMLTKHNCRDRKLSVSSLAGIAAYNCNQYEAAEKLFGVAQKEGKLAEEAEPIKDLIPYYQEAWAKEQKIRAAEAKADNLPRVLLKTTQGDIEVELFENEAPNTVANFISLVEKKFYDGLVFHRVLAGFMAQGGCPKGDGTGGPGYFIPCECHQPNHRLHFRGTLSMAKQAAPNTGGSQFFLTFVPTRHLDGQHTAFGRVVKGFEVLAKLQRIDPSAKPSAQSDPPKPDTIVEAKVLRKRNHEYVPKTLAEF